MPEPASSPPMEDDLMYSLPLPPHDLRWLAQRVLSGTGRFLVGILLCALAVGVILLFTLLVILVLGFLNHRVTPLVSPFR